MIGAAIGLILIVLVLWNLRGHRKHGDGKVETWDVTRNPEWMSDDWPAGPHN